jgi:RNA polymerase sigma-70 factor (ECF subfamily)
MEIQKDGAGNEDTRWLIARELPRLRRYARALRNDAGADDLVQDCIERALRKHSLWRRGTNMRAWLFRILYNLHLSSMRSHKRAPQTVPLDLLLPGSVGGCDGNQLETLELKELAAAFRDLPAEQRDVIALVALEGMRYDEAAEILGVAMGTVRSRLSRGRAALREALAGREALSRIERTAGRGRERAPMLRRVK